MGYQDTFISIWRALTSVHIFRNELLRACWSHTPSKRPTAVEIVELLNSNPRLVSPCIDVPLASVQIERADDTDLGTKHGKLSAIATQKSRLQLIPPDARERSADAYSPMEGNGFNRFSRNETEEDLADGRGGISDPLIEDLPWQTESYNSEDMSPCVGSYVQAGYILVDHN